MTFGSLSKGNNEKRKAPSATQPQVAPAPAGHREASWKETVDFLATTRLVGIDYNGQPTYKAKGGQYAKFGVRIWPEVLPSLGIDPASPHLCLRRRRRQARPQPD